MHKLGKVLFLLNVTVLAVFFRNRTGILCTVLQELLVIISYIFLFTLHQTCSATSGARVIRSAFGHVKWCEASALKKESKNRKRIMSLTFG